MRNGIIKEKAHDLGFSFCGIAQAKELIQAKTLFKTALSANYHGKLAYLERDINTRFSPKKLLKECETVIVCLYNYYTGQQIPSSYQISKYAYIKDYHTFLKEKLLVLAQILQNGDKTLQYKIAVDSSNISEKNWAVEAGLGHYGKNGIFITEKGSWFFIGLLLVNQKADYYDEPLNTGCGTCDICIKSCPTGALVAPYQVDVKRCLSYQTLSSKEPDFDLLKKHPWIYGCDICQDICPKNKKPDINPEAVQNSSLFLHFQNENFENLTKDDFDRYFRGSSIFEKKYERFISIIKNRKENE